MNNIANRLDSAQSYAVGSTLLDQANKTYSGQIQPLKEAMGGFKKYFLANNIRAEHLGRYSWMAPDIGLTRERTQKVMKQYGLTELMHHYNPESDVTLSESTLRSYKETPMDSFVASYKQSSTFNAEFGKAVREYSANPIRDGNVILFPDIEGLEKKILDEKVSRLSVGAKKDYLMRNVVDSNVNYHGAVQEFRTQYVALALGETKGDAKKAAQYLEISEHRVKEIMKEANMKAEDFSKAGTPEEAYLGYVKQEKAGTEKETRAKEQANKETDNIIDMIHFTMATNKKDKSSQEIKDKVKQDIRDDTPNNADSGRIIQMPSLKMPIIDIVSSFSIP